MGDLVEHPESRKKYDFLVQDFIREDSINCVYGKGSTCKSALVMNMVKSVVDGEPFLGKNVKQVNRVLYVSTEMDENTLTDRFTKLETKNIKKIDFLCFQTLGWVDLEKLVKNYDVIVVDILLQFFSGMCDDTNDYKKIYKVFDEIRGREALRNHTWILVHHLNKNGDPLGSTAIEAAADTRMIISMPNGRYNSLRILEVYGKNVEGKELNLKLDFPKMTLMNNEHAEDEKLTSELSYIVEQVIARGTIEGTSTSISSSLGLSKYCRNPITLTKFLKKNVEVLNENHIRLEQGRDHDGRTVKLIYEKEEEMGE